MKKSSTQYCMFRELVVGANKSYILKEWTSELRTEQFLSRLRRDSDVIRVHSFLTMR
jgi:hypothetical protein